MRPWPSRLATPTLILSLDLALSAVLLRAFTQGAFTHIDLKKFANENFLQNTKFSPASVFYHDQEYDTGDVKFPFALENFFLNRFLRPDMEIFRSSSSMPKHRVTHWVKSVQKSFVVLSVALDLGSI